jgi:hypothetical protein
MSTITLIEIAKRAAKADKAETLADVAKILRRLFAPHRRFSAPVYISHSGGSRRVYHDAFSELLEGQRRQVATMCARWPMTKTCEAAIEDANERWAEVFGVRI